MKILYVTTIAVTMGFFPAHIRMLQEAGHQVELACNLDKPLPPAVRELGCAAHHIPFSRSPLSGDNLRAYGELEKLLSKGRYDIVHTHTPNASAIVRLVCRPLRRQGLRVFYTAHGFHFYDGAPLKNWLLYYPVEKLLSQWTDVLITINGEDYRRATGKFRAKKTVYVPGVGMEIERFSVTCSEEERQEKRRELGVPSDGLLLLSVGELNRNKNHSVVIRALATLGNPSIHYCVAGMGALREELESLAAELGVEKQVHLLGYRTDVDKLYQAADVFLCPSIREGLNVSIMEAMASGLPVVASDNRGSRDQLKNNVNGFLCRANRMEEFAAAIEKLTVCPELCAEMGKQNQNVVESFSVEHVLRELRVIYELTDEDEKE